MKRLFILVGLALVIGSIGLTAFTSKSADASACPGKLNHSCNTTQGTCQTNNQETFGQPVVRPASVVCTCDTYTGPGGGSAIGGGFFGSQNNPCNQCFGAQPAINECCSQQSTPGAKTAAKPAQCEN